MAHIYLIFSNIKEHCNYRRKICANPLNLCHPCTFSNLPFQDAILMCSAKPTQGVAIGLN